MRVEIPVAFEVESLEDASELTRSVAESAADGAAFKYLSFVRVFSVTTNCEAVEVFVDGFGMCTVRLVMDDELEK